MVTSTFTSFVFAKRFIEVEALYLQSQNSFAQLECDTCGHWAGLKGTPNSGMHGAAFFCFGAGRGRRKIFGVGQGVKSSERGEVTVRLRAFSGLGGVGQS